VSESESEAYVTTDGTSASLSWNKVTIWDLRPDFCYCQTVAGLLMWGALSDERMGLSFTIDAGPSQRSHSWVRVPWDSRPYFTVSDSRLPFSSPSTTRRATVEVFPFRRLLRLAGLRWRYSIPPCLYHLGTDRIENTVSNRFSVVVRGLLEFPRDRYPACPLARWLLPRTAIVSLFVSKSLPSNGSIRQNIYTYTRFQGQLYPISY
jgi:hypothetical protein